MLSTLRGRGAIPHDGVGGRGFSAFLDSEIQFALRQRQKPDAAARFACLMEWADRLEASGNLEGLHDLAKIMLRPVQALHLSDAYLKPPHGATDSLWWGDSLGFTGQLQGVGEDVMAYIMSLSNVPQVEGAKQLELNLASDIVLPTGWHPSSLTNTLGMIGEGLPAGVFKQSTNHRVSYMYPLGVGWVAGGNHSIAQAVIRGEGRLTPTEFIDVSPVIALVRYDGADWRCMATSRSMGKPCYEEFGWVWEIGRRIVDVKRRS